MNFPIYRNSVVFTWVEPFSSSELSQEKQSSDIVRLTFESTEYIDFQIGDYIVLFDTSTTYVLNKPPRVKEEPKRNTYECVFEGPLHELRKTKVFLTTPKPSGGAYKDFIFPLTGNAKSFLTFIVGNLNRESANYSVGAYEETETVTLDFNNWNVFEAITVIAENLNVSWYLEEGSLNFTSKSRVIPNLFQVGMLAGLDSLTRIRVENENIETVVYGYGGTSNMPPRSEYDSPLLTENRIAFIGEDGDSKLTNNVNKYGRIESVQIFDEIQPEYTGSVTAISESIRTFQDTGVTFNINSNLLEGIKPKITFLDGLLIGMSFNISWDNSTHEITLDTFTDESGDYPNETIKPGIGDTYKLYDIQLPSEYLTDAEDRVQEATQKYLDKQSGDLNYFEAVVSSDFIALNSITLQIGDLIRIVSAKFLIDTLYEIKSLTQNLYNKNKYTIKFGDIYPKSLVSLLKQNNFKVDQEITNINKSSVTNNQVTNIIGEETKWELL